MKRATSAKFIVFVVGVNQIYNTCVIAFIIVEKILLSLELVNIEFLVLALLFEQIFADALSYIFFLFTVLLNPSPWPYIQFELKSCKGWLT